MRLGIFGGTFDPVHYGHLLLAECCREQCRLDQVWFMPAAVPPHKAGLDITPAAARLEMLELATSGYPPFRVSRLELDRGGLSYTVETLAQLAAEDATRELFLLLGADSLADLPNWREPARICQLAWPVVVHRAGVAPPDLAVLRPWVPAERFAASEQLVVEMPQVGLASRELRHRVRHGQSIRFRTPRAVESYIAAQNLYRGDEPADAGGAGCGGPSGS